jgi:hypothetical protein
LTLDHRNEREKKSFFFSSSSRIIEQFFFSSSSSSFFIFDNICVPSFSNSIDYCYRWRDQKKNTKQKNATFLFSFSSSSSSIYFFPIQNKIKTAEHRRCKFIYMQTSVCVCVYSVWLLYINIYTHEHRLLACIRKEKLISVSFFLWLISIKEMFLYFSLRACVRIF